jgi:hypothetical protein
MALNALLSRRSLLGLLAAFPFAPALHAQAKPEVSVSKDPDCGCCGGWVDHLRRHGFPVRVTETTRLQPIKARLGVPSDLASCHTAEVGGYVIEGHVPAHAIERLLTGRPQATGLAVPGMPIGSPGMEGDDAKPYEVILFDKGRREVFARYLRDQPL